MSQLMISISGVRGVVGEGSTPEVALTFAQAFGTYCKAGAKVFKKKLREYSLVKFTDEDFESV